MNEAPRAALPALALLLSAATGLAQPSVVPCAAVGPEPPPCAEAPAPPPLATIDGAAIRNDDLAPDVEQAVEELPAAVAEARREALGREIDDALFALEAARRGVLPRDLYFTEVTAKVVRPTAGEVVAEISANPGKYGARRDDETTRAWAAGILFDRREEERERAFAKELEARFPVTPGVDAAAPSLPPDAVLATVGGRAITAASVKDPLDTAEAWVRFQAWQKESADVRRVLHERLLVTEAARRKVDPDELTRTEVTAKIAPASESDLKAAWAKWKEFYDPDFAKARASVAAQVARERKQEAEKAFDAKLTAGHEVKLAAAQPAFPVQRIETGTSPALGDPGAKVTVVEWGDFECPPCGMMSRVVAEALAPYGERVRYVFRESPLSFHPFAWKAAEAALAAQAQGKFFPYARLLFAHQKELDVPSLKRWAAEAGLDVERFARDLDSGRFAPLVREEKRAGQRHGVRGTPAFFVNGTRLPFGHYSVEGIRAAIDEAMKR